jgi:hypothetical protein
MKTFKEILDEVMEMLFQNIEKGKEFSPEDYRELYREYLNICKEEAEEQKADSNISVMKDEGLI